MDKKDQWQQARSKDRFEAGTLVAFSSQVSKGSWRPSFIRILFIRVSLIRETKLRRHIRRLRVLALAANMNWWKVWLGDYYFRRRDCALLCTDLYRETMTTNVYVLHIIWESMESNLKKGAIDILSLPCIYCMSKQACMFSALSILFCIFLSIHWTTVYNDFHRGIPQL